MKLPQGEKAIVDLRKLEEYCLSTSHPRGRHKARVFASYGIRISDARELREAILVAAVANDAVAGIDCPFGQRYSLDFVLTWNARWVPIRTTWIIETGTEAPRLTSCFVI